MSVELEDAKVKVAQFQKQCEDFLVIIVQQKRDADDQQKVLILQFICPSIFNGISLYVATFRMSISFGRLIPILHNEIIKSTYLSRLLRYKRIRTSTFTHRAT